MFVAPALVTPGGGASKFQLFKDLGRGLDRRTAKLPPMEPEPDRRSLRVVVVDDNYDANVAISLLLERAGFQVAGRAYDGLSGLNVIKSTQPDVAILDIAMPALDGYGLARRIHSEISNPPHLVALTGFGEESDKVEAQKAGFDAYFRKPANWPQLESLLENYVRH
jgi:CheY-like chemotaxis protein